MARPCPPGTTLYTIKAGDTFFGLAERFNTSVPALVSANPNVDPNNLQIGQVICVPRLPIFPSCPEGNYYTIKAGDTLYSIARFYNISPADLLEANPGIDPQRLRIGQVICIPVAVPPVKCPTGTFSYTIKPGDTFYRLAQRYNISVDSIIKANPTVDPEALLIGQLVCIPKA